MDEIENLSQDSNTIKIDNLSIDELKNYKVELKNLIKRIDEEIRNRILKKSAAENLFKK